MAEKIYTNEKGEYLKNNPNWHVEDSLWKANQILKILNRNTIQPKSVAEIGCGAGEILNQLHISMPKDVVFKGYDISIDAIRLAKRRQKERLTFEHTNFLETNSKYQLLLVMDVFEHVDDYLGFLKLCKNKVENTIFHIPLDVTIMNILKNKLISRRKSVGHLHYFTKETAIATLVDTGYDIVDVFYTEEFIDLSIKKTIKAKLFYFMHKSLYKMNKDFAARLFGGVSLLVLTK